MIPPTLYVWLVVAAFVGFSALLGVLVWWTFPGLGRLWARLTKRPGREIRWLAVDCGQVWCPDRGRLIYAWDYCRECPGFVGFDSPCADQGWVKCRAPERARKRHARPGYTPSPQNKEV